MPALGADLSEPDRLCFIAPAQRELRAIGDDGTRHQGGLIEELGVGVALSHPRIEIAVGLGFAIHEVIAKFRQQRRPFILGQTIRADIAKRHIMPRLGQRLAGFVTVGTCGQAVEDHGAGLSVVWVTCLTSWGATPDGQRSDLGEALFCLGLGYLNWRCARE